MTEILKGLMADLVNSTVDSFNGQLMASFESVLRVETLNGGDTVLSAGVIETVYQYIYLFVSSLIVLKFLFKGFSIWILWRDGDADSSPQDMLIGSIQAIITIIAFPFFYNILANVAAEFTSTILSLIQLPSSGQVVSGTAIGEALMLVPLVGMGLADIIIWFIYLILFAVLYVILLRRGFELLILRFGVPFACIGLLDSDYGTWKAYIQTLNKTLFTSIIQIVAMSISMTMVGTGHLINGIILVSVAFSAPNLLQQFMVPTGRGGGLTNKIYTTSIAVRAVRGLVGR